MSSLTRKNDVEVFEVGPLFLDTLGFYILSEGAILDQGIFFSSEKFHIFSDIFLREYLVQVYKPIIHIRGYVQRQEGYLAIYEQLSRSFQVPTLLIILLLLMVAKDEGSAGFVLHADLEVDLDLFEYFHLFALQAEPQVNDRDLLDLEEVALIDVQGLGFPLLLVDSLEINRPQIEEPSTVILFFLLLRKFGGLIQ
jgi:hypothetical protein